MKTKTHLLDRQLADLHNRRDYLNRRIGTIKADIDVLNIRLNVETDNLLQVIEDISTIEQLITDLFPEPRD